jgi:hypothetical protein
VSNPDYLISNLGTKEGSIRQYVIDRFLSTGEHLFISDIAKAFRTTTTIVDKALAAGGGHGFDRYSVYHYRAGQGSSGRFVRLPAVEPSKGLLVALIGNLNKTAA